MDWSPLWISLRVATCATLLCLLVGVPIGYVLGRCQPRARPLWEGATLLPLILPPTVLGYYLLVAFGIRSPLGRLYRQLTGGDLVFSWQGAAVAASIVGLPLLARSAQAAFAALDEELISAARSLGASEFQIFRFVIVPLARRGLIAGTALAFARSLGEFGATLMVAGAIPGRTLTMPIAIYEANDKGDIQTALIFTFALSALCVLFSALVSTLESDRERGRRSP